MSKIIAIVGCNYGDEGKGLYVDYFSHQLQEGIVIRYNGSCQSTHTVTLDNGQSHVFKHFGSGTFNNWPTVWSHHCAVHPFLFRSEHQELAAMGYTPILNVHRECCVITPYDTIVNQIIESIRNTTRHSSSGIGFGEAIQRHENFPELRLQVCDLHQSKHTLHALLTRIKDRLLSERLLQLFPTIKTVEINKWIEIFAYYSEDICNEYVDSCEYFIDNSTIIKNYSLLNTNHVIFEGCHGLSLDQTFGDHPHVTRSNTGLKNIIDITDRLNNVEQLEVTYVTRNYVTRHGNGLLDSEMKWPEQLINKDTTNCSNEFQGQLRYAPLNVTRMYNAIQYDLTYAYHIKYPLVSKIAFTWLDHKQNLLRMNGQLYKHTPEQFDAWVHNTGKYGSYGKTRQDVVEFNK